MWCLGQWFSNFRVHQKPTIRVSDSVVLVCGPRFCTFLTSFQVLMLLVWDHILRTTGLTNSCSTIKALLTCLHLVSRLCVFLVFHSSPCCFFFFLWPPDTRVPPSSNLSAPVSLSPHFLSDFIQSHSLKHQLKPDISQIFFYSRRPTASRLFCLTATSAFSLGCLRAISYLTGPSMNTSYSFPNLSLPCIFVISVKGTFPFQLLRTKYLVLSLTLFFVSGHYQILSVRDSKHSRYWPCSKPTWLPWSQSPLLFAGDAAVVSERWSPCCFCLAHLHSILSTVVRASFWQRSRTMSLLGSRLLTTPSII